MTIAMALLCFSLFAQPPAQAPDGTAVVRLMPHAELMKLGDEDRENYLEDVREAMVEYEKRMGKYLDELSVNDRLPRLFQFVEEAYAEESKVPDFRCLYAGWAVQGNKCRPQAAVKYNVRFSVMISDTKKVMDDQIVMDLACPKR